MIPRAIHPFLMLSLPLLLGATAYAAPQQGATGTPQGAAPSSGLAERTGLQVDVDADEAELELRMTPVVRAVQKAADSVVSIYIVGRDMGSTLATNRRRPRQPQSQGSGVILTADGLAITNWHVVLDALASSRRLEVEVRLRDGRSYPAAVLSSSDAADLALLQIQPPEGDPPLQPITLGDSSKLMVGETVIAIGNPRGNANSVTTGVLSAEDREITVRTPVGVRRYEGLLQTDAAINRGNSGGALLDITGKLIGINNAMAADAENIGFAIPVNTMRKVFDEVLAASENLTVLGTAAWLGLLVDDEAGRPVVSAIQSGGPAAQAGIQAGDQVTRIGDRTVANGLDYARGLLQARVGVSLPIELLRDDEILKLEITPERRVVGQLRALMGMELREDRDPDALQAAGRAFSKGRAYRRYRFQRTLRVHGVEPGGPAEALGIRAGDYVLGRVVRVRSLLRVREQDDPIASLSGLAEAARTSRDSIKLLLLRDGKLMEGTLQLRR